MKCDNSCPEQADFTLYRTGFDPVNVCQAHIFVTKANVPEGQYIVRPITLKSHIEDYRSKAQ